MSAAKCWRRCSDEPHRKKPVAIPSGVTATIRRQPAVGQGPQGDSEPADARRDQLCVEDGVIVVKPANATKAARAFWGMQRTLVENLITGVTQGFSKKLLITGVGYRANSQGKTLKQQLGYSHDVDYAVPEGIEIKTRTTRPSRSAASTSRRSARWPPRSAAGASPSPTGQGPSSTTASLSSAKKARRSKPWRNSLSSTGAPPPCPHRPQGPRRWQAAPVRASFRPAYLCQSSTIRRARPLPAASTLDKDLKGTTGATAQAAAEVGKRLAERPSRPASPRSCSIAVASSFMAA